MGTESLLVLFFAGLFFAGAALIVSALIHPTSKNPQKKEPYECGIQTIGTSKIQFKIGYYLFALIFLLFDVELIFLYPWAVAIKDFGVIAFIEMFIFLVILLLGLVYAWKKGALKWV
ncbi:MAG: NADH-quinone oxidoreductase subunit A [Bacteroidetes bacterium]|nr:NADH-quinone oxidoreductase subunit A [Bacteroidota bacterium]